MYITEYELIDTALKIGLGALIGGSFSIITIILNNRNEKKKLWNTRRNQLIEDVLEELAAFNKTQNFFFNLSRLIDEHNQRGIPPPPDKLELWYQKFNDFDAFLDVGKTVAKLQLLGEIATADLVYDYVEYLSALRNEVLGSDGKVVTFSSEAQAKHRLILKEQRRNIYKELSRIYKDESYPKKGILAFWRKPITESKVRELDS